MFTKFLAVTVLFSISIGTIVCGVQEQQAIQKDTSKFMARKLEASSEIMAGLAMEDFGKISRSAQDLMLLSHEADWNVLQTEPYLRMSSEFRSSAERLRDNAKAENLDGATLSFFEVTLNCVRCHKYVRGNRKPGKK